MVLELSKLTYEERLRMLEISTLENKRGDLINIYRMINGMENVDKKCFINLDTEYKGTQ